MSTPTVWTRAPGRHGLGRLFRYCQRLAARSGGKFLYLVPNQGLLRVRGARNQGRRAKLMTLLNFGEEVVRSAFPERTFLDDRDRWIVVGRVIDGLLAGGDLPYTKEVARTASFIAGAAAAIGELKEACITPDHCVPEGPLETEFTRIYAGYEANLAERNLLDSAGILSAAVNVLENGAALNVLDGTVVGAAEGFFALTPLQRRLMEALAGRLPSFWVEALDESGEPLFATIRDSIQGWRVARRSARERTQRASADPLAHLERALFRRRPITAVGSADRIRLVTGPGIEGEVAEVAREVKRLIQVDHYPPDQIALIIPDQQRYGQPLQRAMREYGIPFRATEPVSEYPFGRFVLDLVDLAGGEWNQSVLIRTLRAPYAGVRWLSESAIDWLEGAAYAWPPPKSLTDWNGNLTAMEADPQAAAAREGLAKLAAELAALADRHPVPEYCEIMRSLLESLQIEQQILRMSRANPDDPTNMLRTARELSALHAVGRVLNRMQQVYGLWGSSFSAKPDEFYTLLEKELDQEFHRADPRSPGPGVELLGPGQAYGRRFAITFVLGLADGILPGGPRTDFLMSDRRRQQRGLPTFADRYARERLLFLMAVTRAQNRLYVSYPSSDDAEEFLRSPFVDDLLDVLTDGGTLSVLKRELSDVIPGLDRVASREEMVLAAACVPESYNAARNLIETLRAGGHLPNSLAVEHALWVAGQRNSTEYTPWEGRMADGSAQDRLAALYPDTRIISVRDAEKAAVCPFRFLGEQILGLNLWEPWQLREDPLEMGSLRHAILSGFWLRWAKPLTREAMPEAQAVMTQVVIEQAAACATGLRQKVALLRWAASWLEGEVGLAETFDGQFVPKWLELGFGRTGRPDDMDPNSTLQPLEVEVAGKTYRFKGVIDRVDMGSDADGPAIIYDYKGSNARDWGAAVKTGLNLQPMLYAKAVESLFQPGAAVAGAAYYFTNERTKTRADVGTGIWREDLAGKLSKRGEKLTGDGVAALVEEAVLTAANTVDAIRVGDFRVAHRERCPSWCGLRFACRRFDDNAPFVKGEEPDAVSE